MRKQDHKNKKKTRNDKLQQVEPEQLNKKKFSHQVMQMQTLYGNRVVERTIRKMNKKEESVDAQNSPEMNFLDPELVPVHRSWNDEQISGMRVYLTRNQFHYNHQSKLPKKQTAQTIETDKSGQLNDQKGEETRKVDDEIGHSNSTLAHTNKNETKNQDAKKYFTSRHAKSDIDSSHEIETPSPSTEVDNLEDTISEVIKYGRFSFIGAYPHILLALRKNKKEENNKNKSRKKSKLSRYRNRFSGKI